MHNRSFVTVLVHLVWATRRRQRILSPEHDPWLAHVLSRKCFEAGSQPFAIGIARDHAHMAVGLGATTPLSELVRKLKGASSRLWNVSRSPRLSWQDGYWAASIRPVDLPALRTYLEHQRQYHRVSMEREDWMTLFNEANRAKPAPAGFSNFAVGSEPADRICHEAP